MTTQTSSTAFDNKVDNNSKTAVNINTLFNDDLLYAIVDSAMDDDHKYMHIMDESIEWRCLYHGEEAELLEEVAPYLVLLEEGHPFTQWVVDEVYGHNAVSFLNSSQDIDTLASHLSGYAKVQIPVRDNVNDNNNNGNDNGNDNKNDGEQRVQWAFFAFYDPRVFPQFVESNTDEQNGAFFQGINTYYCENTQNIDQLNSYDHHNGTVQQSSINLMQTSEQPPEQASSKIANNAEDHTHG